MEPNADSTAFTVIPSDSEPDMAYGFTQATEELIMAVKYFKMGAQLQSRSVPDEHDKDSGKVPFAVHLDAILEKLHGFLDALRESGRYAVLSADLRISPESHAIIQAVRTKLAVVARKTAETTDIDAVVTWLEETLCKHDFLPPPETDRLWCWDFDRKEWFYWYYTEDPLQLNDNPLE